MREGVNWYLNQEFLVEARRAPALTPTPLPRERGYIKSFKAVDHMQRLKRILIATGVVLLVMLLIGFLLPSGWQVERSIVIRAPAATIFPYINNLKNGRVWAVW